jgi:hypothetical protein
MTNTEDHYRPLLALALFVAATLMAATASAEPYMAVRDGFACGDCHTNRSGGGMRTLTAEMHATDILRLPNDGEGLLPAYDDWFSPNVSDYFSIGGDFRAVDKLLLQDNPDADGNVSNNTTFRDIESNDMDVEQATIYAHLRLIPDTLSFYIDEKVAPGGASNREAFLMLDRLLPWEGAYIKAGRFFPAWGLKLQDDEAFVNSASGFSFDKTVAGLEMGRSGEGTSWFLSVTEGTEDSDTDQLFTASAYKLWDEVGGFSHAMAGISAAHDAPDDGEINAFAVYGGASVGRTTVLLQADLLDTETDVDGDGAADDDVQAWAVYGEANYLWRDWMNTKVAFDIYDPSDNEGEDTMTRISFGIEPFIDRFLQLRLFYRIFNGPENEPATNRDELTLEAHLFF